jgi:hypothetical protein
MADLGGSLTFTFDADTSNFTRALDSAGAKLDALTQRARTAGTGQPLDVSNGLSRAASSASDDASQELTRLTQQLALLQTTGAAHAAIAEQMKIEAAQAKLGSDATEAQKAAAASLVQQIDAATASQSKLQAAQTATTQAWRFGSNELASGIESLVLQGGRLKDVAASILDSFARQGLSAALTGSGPLAGLFGTSGGNGATGGLFGALGSLFSGGAATAVTGFSGLYANGGRIGAGQWGVVGEKGAEIVSGPATVTPWAKAVRQAGAAPTQVIQFNVTTPDAPSFARSESQMSALVSRAVTRGGRNS